MGKFYELIVLQSPKSTDSFELIDPVNNLTLENVQTNSTTEIVDQSNQSQEIIQRQNKIKYSNTNRFHPYSKRKRSDYKIERKREEDQCDMDFLKSFGYIEYSANKKFKGKDKIESLFVEINQSIKQTFAKYFNRFEQIQSNEPICTKRFH